jgi:hypothetical protein
MTLPSGVINVLLSPEAPAHAVRDTQISARIPSVHTFHLPFPAAPARTRVSAGVPAW